MTEESRNRLSEKAEAAAQAIHQDQEDHDQFLVIATDGEELSINTGIKPKDAAPCFYELSRVAPHLAAAVLGGIMSYVQEYYDGDQEDFTNLLADGPQTTQ